MRRGLVSFALAAVVAAVAVPVSAHPPTTTTVSQQAVLTNPTACGSYGVEWRINLTAEVKRYFDDQGRLTHVSSTSRRTTRSGTR